LSKQREMSSDEQLYVLIISVQAEKSDSKCYDKGNSLDNFFLQHGNARLECRRGWPILRGQLHLRINVNNLAGERRLAIGLQSRNRSTFDDYSRTLNLALSLLTWRVCKWLFLSFSLSSSPYHFRRDDKNVGLIKTWKSKILKFKRKRENIHSHIVSLGLNSISLTDTNVKSYFCIKTDWKDRDKELFEII